MDAIRAAVKIYVEEEAKKTDPPNVDELAKLDLNVLSYYCVDIMKSCIMCEGILPALVTLLHGRAKTIFDSWPKQVDSLSSASLAEIVLKFIESTETR